MPARLSSEGLSTEEQERDGMCDCVCGWWVVYLDQVQAGHRLTGLNVDICGLGDELGFCGREAGPVGLSQGYARRPYRSGVASAICL